MVTQGTNNTNLPNMTGITVNAEKEYEPNTNQPKYPCPCCKYDCENFDCILCNYCNNWFRQTCATISNKRFNILSNSANLKFKCKFCSSKKQKCFGCEKDINKNTFKKLYCVSCKDWYCKDCLALSTNEMKMLVNT